MIEVCFYILYKWNVTHTREAILIGFPIGYINVRPITRVHSLLNAEFIELVYTFCPVFSDLCVYYIQRYFHLLALSMEALVIAMPACIFFPWI